MNKPSQAVHRAASRTRVFNATEKGSTFMKFTTLGIAAMALCASAAPAFAQSSSVQRANERERSSIEYRQENCPSGDRGACARANERARRSIEYRNQHATRYSRNPSAAIERANQKNRDSIAYRNAHCRPEDARACARANEKDRGAIEYRNANSARRSTR